MVEENERRGSAAAEATREFKARPEVRELLARFARSLDRFPSKAAIWQHLRDAGFHVAGQSSFTSKWAGGDRFLRFPTPSDIGRILTVLRESAPDLRAEISRIEQVGEKLPEEPVRVLVDRRAG